MKPRTVREGKKEARKRLAQSVLLQRQGQGRGENSRREAGGESTRHRHAGPRPQVAEAGARVPLHSGVLFYKQQSVFTREREAGFPLVPQRIVSTN